MPTVYLDTNIISFLHHPEDYSTQAWRHDLPLINTYLEESTDTKVLYSPAHLMDVRKGYIKNQPLAIEKLRFIGRITRNLRLTKYFGSHEMYVEEVVPETFFFQETENNAEFHVPSDVKLNYLALIESFPAYDKLKSKYLDLSKVEQALSPIGIELARTKQEPTAYNLMCDFAEFMSELINGGFPLYKPFREQAIREANIAQKISGYDDPISLIQSLLVGTSFGLRMQEGMADLLNEETEDREKLIFTLFMNLDFLGFSKDKITERHGFMNLVADATHCFYASYCDIFVTDDEKTSKKAAAVFRHLRLSTEIKSMAQFVDWLKIRYKSL